MGGPRTVVLGALVIGLVLAPVAVAPVAGQQNVTLTVTVVNANGGTVAGVDLAATWDGGSASETTRANGQALIDVPAGADVDISVSHGTYMRNVPFTVEDASTRDVEIPVALEGFSVVSVTDADGALRGARVRFQDGGVTAASVTTAANGLAESGPIEHGSYALIVTKPGYYEHRETVTVENDTEFNVDLERGTVPVSFSVVDDHFDEPRPVQNATIAIEPLGTTLTTLAGGESETGLPVNTKYEVTVSKAGYVSQSQTLSLAESSRSVSVRINREATVSLSTAQDRVVVGESTTVTVTNAYGEPVEGATVTLDGASVGQTDADGELSVPIDAAGAVTVGASYEGASAEVTVEGFQPGGGTPSPTEAPGTDGGLGPGPGLLGALLAVGLAGALLARRR